MMGCKIRKFPATKKMFTFERWLTCVSQKKTSGGHVLASDGELKRTPAADVVAVDRVKAGTGKDDEGPMLHM
jgi:hypothetical protein